MRKCAPVPAERLGLRGPRDPRRWQGGRRDDLRPRDVIDTPPTRTRGSIPWA